MKSTGRHVLVHLLVFSALVFTGLLLGTAPTLAQTNAAGASSSQANSPQANFKVTLKQSTSTAEPPVKLKGDSICYELGLTPKRTICDYLPKHETASVLLSRILTAIFDGRQPADPSEAYIRVVGNNQLEFMSIDPAKIELIIDYLSHVDVLDTFIERRFVNVNLQIVELVKNSDENMGYLLSGRAAGKTGAALDPTDRLAVTALGGIVTSTFAIGNLVNTVLNIALTNFKEKEDISVVSTLPFRVTHGFDLGTLAPLSQTVYRPFSIQTITENVGIKFQGEARLHRDQPNKILLKNFTASVTQVNSRDMATTTGPTMGAKTFRAGPVDLVLETGCSAIIRVLNQTESFQRKRKNWFFSSSNEKDEASRDFLFVIQATEDSQGTAPSTTCDQTGRTQP